MKTYSDIIISDKTNHEKNIEQLKKQKEWLRLNIPDIYSLLRK